MRVWLVTTGEPLPTDSGCQRLLRTGLLAQHLEQAGHEVVWWTSTFDHTHKVHRYSSDAEQVLSRSLRLRLLHSPGYQRNVSIARLLDHRCFANRFRAAASRADVPDIILCSLPTIDLCSAATEYGKVCQVPVVIDVRDLWPDAFLELSPIWARGMARLALTAEYRRARNACGKATAIIGATPAFVEWGLRNAARPATSWDRDFPLAYDNRPISSLDLRMAETFWDSLGVVAGVPRACFFGAINRQFDLDTVIAAARLLEKEGTPIQFVLCGVGDSLHLYRDRAQGCKSVVFPGWVAGAQIRVLMHRSSVGLAPYRNTANFLGHIPNKILEYISHGLPVVTSLQGNVSALLSEAECGEMYREGNSANLASCLTRITGDESRRSLLQSNAHKLHVARFEPHRLFAAIVRYLEQLVSDII